MKKELTPYTLGKPSGEIIQIFQHGKPSGFGMQGIASCLEAIFVFEGANKKDWYIAEGNKVFRVKREDFKISKDREEEICSKYMS